MPAEDAFDLDAFHAGSRELLGSVYRAHFAAVSRAARQILAPVDAETVVHEVFHRLIANAEMRKKFEGGDLGAWLARVAKNLAIDHRRKYSREEPLPEDRDPPAPPTSTTDLDAKRIVERFQKECLPPKYAAVFKARFLEGKDQRSAAAAVGIPRSTLVYQEQQIRELLRRFVLEQT
ncbi:MAG TPA: sigma-70 family RNA polymerase sigma factor [Labilithrix sp.]|jgi:RNA polymerase sigma-70 factor (ECF subfamily)